MLIPRLVLLCLGLVTLHAGDAPLATSIRLVGAGGGILRTATAPAPLVLRPELGLVTHTAIDGSLLYTVPPAPAVKGKLPPALAAMISQNAAIRTPGGDYLLMFPAGGFYSIATTKVNDMLTMRSRDRGKTWSAPKPAFAIAYNQHGWSPLVPRGGKRIYAFGTQPVPGEHDPKGGALENTPIGFRWSDDDGLTWSDVTLIRPVNDPGFRGMSIMRMCETTGGAWLIGSHAADWSVKPLRTRQYLLRSEDQGKTWTVLPGKRPDGWFVQGFDRMDEGRVIALDDGKVLLMARTPAGKLFAGWSSDDGRTWTAPKPTSLIHPDAPPMLFHLSDGKTLVCFHHNRSGKYTTLTGDDEMQKDRAELWLSLSRDGGHTWSVPRFLLVNALAPAPGMNAWTAYQCSYVDCFADEGRLHLFMPHRWSRELHLTIAEPDLERLPTAAELAPLLGQP